MSQSTVTGWLCLLPFQIYSPFFYYKKQLCRIVVQQPECHRYKCIGKSYEGWNWPNLLPQAQPHPDFDTSARVLQKLWVPNIMADSVPNRPVDYYTCAFRRSKMEKWGPAAWVVVIVVCVLWYIFLFICSCNWYDFFARFLGSEDQENYFTNTQRQRIVSTLCKCSLTNA